jgi:Fe2+ or Zn2+ uptake regulation protein
MASASSRSGHSARDGRRDRTGRPGPGDQAGHADVPGVEEVLGLLRADGGRITTSRRLLVRTLVERQEHATAEELASLVHSEAPDVHLSTIYRNLDELERLGVVSHAHLGHGAATYHLSTAAHGHLVCEECGGMLEAPDELFDDFAALVAERYSFLLDSHHFAVIGRCAACSEAASSGAASSGAARSEPPRESHAPQE